MPTKNQSAPTDWVPLEEAARTLLPRKPNGQAYSLVSVEMWLCRGVAGVKLRCHRLGRARYLTPALVAEFIDATAKAREKRASKPRRRKAAVHG